MRVFDGLETAVLTAVLDEEDDFRRGTPGRAFRAAVVLAVVAAVVLPAVAAVVLVVGAAVVLAVVAFVTATTFRRPRGGRSGLAFRAFPFLRSSFEEAESPSSLITVLYDSWSLAAAAAAMVTSNTVGRRSFGDSVLGASIPSGIVGVADDRAYGIGGDGGASGNAFCRKSVIALCEENFDEPS